MGTNKKNGKSKLLSFKKWLTIDESLSYLSMLLEEEISEADLLRLVLEGNLKISVNFVNPIAAVYRKLITSELKQKMIDDWTGREKDYSEDYGEGESAIFEEVLQAVVDEAPLKVIQGVWDLPMIGAERMNIEYYYSKSTGGPSPDRLRHVTKSCGAYVEDEKGVWQLHQTYEVTEHSRFLPCYYLPEDCQYVIRTENLISFHKSFFKHNLNEENEIDSRTQRTYLNIIGALLDITTGIFKDNKFDNETQLRDFLAEKYDDMRGMGVRNTASIFAAAKRAINGDLD